MDKGILKYNYTEKWNRMNILKQFECEAVQLASYRPDARTGMNRNCIVLWCTNYFLTELELSTCCQIYCQKFSRYEINCKQT